MLPQCSHITKKRGVFYYRRRIPMTATGEVALSLQTCNYRCAEHRTRRLDHLFIHLVRLMTDRSKIASILRHYLNERIAADERSWLRGETYARDVDDGEAPLQAEIRWTEYWLNDARRDAASRDYAGVEEAANQLLAEHGLPEDDFPEVAYGIVQARVPIRRDAAF
jgi:hypothetical protein